MARLSSQANAIRAALKSRRKLTPMDALKDFGCFRLGARIYDLRRQGMKIKSRLKDIGGKHVAEYYVGKT